MRNYAIVLLTTGHFAGAQRRFTNLFFYLYKRYPANAYYFVSFDLYDRIKNIYKGYPLNNVIPIGAKSKHFHSNIIFHGTETVSINQKKEENISQLRKIYRFLKSYKVQYALYRQIEKYRRKYNINVFLGVYSGIIPLYFYLKKKSRDVGIIFTDMDSWFSDVYTDMKKYWYKKYSSFNFALENSDIIDFLSPFILQGVKERGLKVEDNKVSITECSFADYSKCKIGDKSKFQIAFSGRLEKDKNPELFLSAAIYLSQKYLDIVFHVIGEGRLSHTIKERIEEEGNERIIFHGFASNPSEILADTLVFVSIQTTNNYPSQSVLEAMACGNTIIASDVGDTRMFINEKNGMLINLTLKELINAMELMYLRRERTLEMGLFAEECVKQNHTVEKAAEYYLDLFEKVHGKIKLKN